jgi:hypothetical protein
MGSTYSTNNFTLSSKPAFCARSGTIKDFGEITRVASVKRSLEGHWGGAKGTSGFWAAGPGCGLPCGEQAWPKGQALALADLARGLGVVGVAHMRSVLGLSSIYRQQKGWLPLLRKTSAAALA